MIGTHDPKCLPLRLSTRLIVALAIGSFCLVSIDHAAASSKGGRRSAKNLATELARLRAEVEELSDRVETKKSEVKAKLQSFARQKSELEMQVRREEVRVAQLKKRHAERKAKVAARKKEAKLFEPVVEQGAELLIEAIRRGLPFKTRDRIDEVERVVEQMKQDLLTPAVAVARLWERVEDELRLARENGIYSQVIPFAGSEQLVDVARLGMVLMYFRTRDGRYGMVERNRKKDGWRYRLLADREKWQPVAALFDALKKQIRAGFFVLPNALGRFDISAAKGEER
jgi:hypothetical protein